MTRKGDLSSHQIYGDIDSRVTADFVTSLIGGFDFKSPSSFVSSNATSFLKGKHDALLQVILLGSTTLSYRLYY